VNLIVCRDARVLRLLWQVGVAQWRARELGGDLGAHPMSSSQGLRIIGPMWVLVSMSALFRFCFRYVFKLEHFLIYVFLL
jgi:hypothetical protein